MQTTSLQAKDKMDSTGATIDHERIINGALICIGGYGNAQDISSWLGGTLNSVEVTRRLAGMEKKGMIFKTKVTTPSKINGNSMYVWALKGVKKIVIDL